jgi:hypothetical protein
VDLPFLAQVILILLPLVAVELTRQTLQLRDQTVLTARLTALLLREAAVAHHKALDCRGAKMAVPAGAANLQLLELALAGRAYQGKVTLVGLVQLAVFMDLVLVVVRGLSAEVAQPLFQARVALDQHLQLQGLQYITLAAAAHQHTEAALAVQGATAAAVTARTVAQHKVEPLIQVAVVAVQHLLLVRVVRALLLFRLQVRQHQQLVLQL